MPTVNTVTLVGRLTRDPDVRGQDDKPIVSFAIAVDRFGQNKGADFVDCVCYDRLASSMRDLLAKGRQVMVDGHLHQATWEKDGQKRSKLEVVARNIQLIDRPKTDEPREGRSRREEESDDADSWS